jgi:hypothetical protein
MNKIILITTGKFHFKVAAAAVIVIAVAAVVPMGM